MLKKKNVSPASPALPVSSFTQMARASQSEVSPRSENAWPIK